MRVCFLTTCYPRWQGDAAGFFIQEIVNALAIYHKTEIVVITPADAKINYCEKSKNISIYRFMYFWPNRLQKLAYGDGIPWNLRHSIISWLNIPFFLLAAIFRMFSVAKKIDIIHANWGIFGAIATFFQFFHKKPVVVMIHGSDLSSRNKLITSITRWAIKHADAVIANSPENYELCRYLRKNSAKTYYINNGVKYFSDEELLELKKTYGKNDNNVKFLSMARLIPERKFDSILKAFAVVCSKRNDVFLTIVGDGPELENLKSLSKTLGIVNNIRFTGRIPHFETQRYLAEADVYISATTVETHGSSIAEAAVFGLPIIVTRIGFPAHFVIHGQTGFVIEPNNGSQLEDAIEKIVEDSEFRKKAGNAMRKRVTELGISWQGCAEKTMEVYNSLMKVSS